MSAAWLEGRRRQRAVLAEGLHAARLKCCFVLRPIAFAHSVVRLANSKAVASSLRLMVPANMRYTIKQRHQIAIAATKL